MKHRACIRFCAIMMVIVAAIPAMNTSARAQAWIGAIAGEAAGEAVAAAQEKACREGAPPDPDDVERAHRRVERTMASYFELTSKSDAKDIQDLFASDKDDVSWKDSSGTVPITALAARLDVPTPQRTLVAFVVAGDNKTARVIWSVAPTEGTDAAFYAVDFVNQGWLSGWRIWHMTILPASTPPDAPPAYCHFEPDQSF